MSFCIMFQHLFCLICRKSLCFLSHWFFLVKLLANKNVKITFWKYKMNFVAFNSIPINSRMVSKSYLIVIINSYDQIFWKFWEMWTKLTRRISRKLLWIDQIDFHLESIICTLSYFLRHKCQLSFCVWQNY